MPEELKIDRARTAVLIMDYQNEIVGGLPEKTQSSILDNASKILRAARQADLPVIYVVVNFREGYPDVSPRNKGFSGIIGTGRFLAGSLKAEIHPGVAPQKGDIIVTKRRVGAFSSTDLETMLRARDINNLILFGVSTSGCVLTTVRDGADADYGMVVVSDACADRDEEVHRVLLDKILPRQANMATTEEVLKAVSS
jgi:nicotinamidase-related amidase